MNNKTISNSAIFQNTAMRAAKYKEQRDDLLAHLMYWLPAEPPFNGLVGSQDIAVAKHMEKWHESRAIIKKVEES